MNAITLIFPAGHGRIHYDMFSWSLDALSRTLRRDIYNLQDPGSMVEDIPDPDPLASIRYSCMFWVDHLCEADDQSLGQRKELSDDGAIFAFLKEHFLHWVESWSLISKHSDGVLSIKKLLHKVQLCQDPESACSLILILNDNSLNLPQLLGLQDSYGTLKSLCSVIDQL